jgi:tetratricopeptide (TPR) repeat protein
MEKPALTTQTWIAIALAVLLASPLRAQPPDGQEDLDQAVEIKLFAGSEGDLNRVIALCETALEKGLDEENELLAKRVLAATLYQYGEVLSRPVLEDRSLDQRALFLARQALPKLRRAVEIDNQQGDAFYLIASLESLPGGDREQAGMAVEEAVELAKGKHQLARVLVLQGELMEDPQHQLAKYNEALKVQPNCGAALRHRGLFYLADGENEKAIADFEMLHQRDSLNLDALRGLVEAQTNLHRYDAAQRQLDQALQIAPSDPLNYILQARLRAAEGKIPEAIDVLGEALSVNPRDVSALLMRAQLRLSVDQPEGARKDLDRVLSFQLAPVQALLMPRLIAEKQEDPPITASALSDPIRNTEKNRVSQMRLASTYAAGQRPWKAISIFTKILREDPEDVDALRGRAEMRLGVGQPSAAVDDYEQALQFEPKNTSVLNNLAWVLATSLDGKIRDAQRSIQLSQRACRLTDYQRADTLSTLAAGYAEAGDFEKAVDWARKAIELNQNQEAKEQLRKELNSYEQEKPWRERQ